LEILAFRALDCYGSAKSGEQRFIYRAATMPRFKIPEILLGCLLTVAVFAIGVAFGLRTTADAGAGGTSWLVKDAAGFFTFVLVIVAAIQAWMFFVQLRYMRLSMHDTTEAAQAARDTAIAAREQVRLAADQIEVTRIGIFDLERAFLDVGPSSIVTSFVSDPPPAKGYFQPGVDPMEIIVKINLKNTGRTRAVIVCAYGEFSTNSLGATPAYNSLIGTKYVTDVSMSADGGADFPHDFRTRQVADQFFFGYVEYKDIFRRVHTSRFCMRLYPAYENGQSGRMQFAGADSWRECD
jgi:hypothetical protein